MANNLTYLNNVDENRVEELMQDTCNNATYFTTAVQKVVDSYSEDLNGLMNDLYSALTQRDPISTDALERYYAELTNMVYFMSDKVEKLNVYSDMSKAAAKEIYNKAYLSASSEKDEKGKSKTTVAENTSIAESASQYETVVSSVYEHAYKTVKMKIDSANEMITTLKNILKRRIADNYNSNQGVVEE